MNKLLLLLVIIGTAFPFPLSAQNKIVKSSGDKPSWIENTASLNGKRSNDTYYLETISIPSDNLQNAIQFRMNELAEKIGKKNQLETEAQVDIQNIESSVVISKIVFNSTTRNKTESQTFYAKLVDEYWEYVSTPTGSSYIYYALYAVSQKNQKPLFDDFETTTSYGAAPIFMSVIPGLGQFYKGSTVKGICMLGGVAACGIGALFLDNERSDYRNKMKEQPQFAQSYNTRANNYETARNVCLGAAAAIWIYNIIDAATAKGARRILVRPAKNNFVSVHPIASPNVMGVSLSYNF